METIYNITAAVDPDTAPAWVEEALATYLPALREISGVTGVELIEVFAPASGDAREAKTFTVQVRFAGVGDFEQFLDDTERTAEEVLFQKFGKKYVTFRLQLNSLHRL